MYDRGFYTAALIAAVLSMIAWIVYIFYSPQGTDYLRSRMPGKPYRFSGMNAISPMHTVGADA